MVKIHQHAEQLIILVVIFLQHVIQVAAAHQHHFDIDWNGLRIKQHRVNHAYFHLRNIHFDFAVFQHQLEGFPHIRVLNHFIHIQQQIPAIGAVQRTGADHAVTGIHRAGNIGVFNPPKQVLIGGIGFVHHRRTGARFAGHQHIGHDLFG